MSMEETGTEKTSIELKPGTRLASAVCDAEVVVVKGPSALPSDKAALTCGGVPMNLSGAAGERVAPEQPDGEGTLLGKRYTDEETGLVVLCTRGGTGSLSLAGRPLRQMATKPLPASD
ncbi:hypothetical protein [Actinomadura vinacea]